MADTLAKQGVEQHRVPKEDVMRWKEEYKVAWNRAKWIGIVTHAANNMPEYSYRDSEASRWRAMAAQRAKEERRKGVDGRRRRRPREAKKEILESEGGHAIVPAESGGGWMCSMCRL